MPDKAFLKRLKALIIFRVFFITAIIGTFLAFDIGYQGLPYPRAILYLIVSLYILSVVYAFMLKMIRNLLAFAYIQLFIDAISSISLVFLTGGIGSWFSSLMLLTVIASVIVINRRAGYIIATTCGILYGFILDLQFYRIIPIGYDITAREKDFLYNIFSHLSALYLTAYLTGYLSSSLEKTSRKLEEKASDLKDLSLFHEEAIENLTSGFLTTDITGKILTFNNAAENITGVNRSAAIGQSITDIFPFVTNPFKAERTEGTITCDSDIKIIGFSISEIINSREQKIGYIFIFQDITKVKNLEAELKHKETLAAIGEISANMAHEIRNPLASLKGSIELLKEDTISRDHKEKLMNIALSEMERLNKIITDFLIFSRPSHPEFRRFDLHSVLNETIDLIKACTGSANIHIEKGLEGRNEIVADPQKLRQVFLNLGMNAIESMPEGGELYIGTRTQKDTVAILFKDTGMGIPAGSLRDIFYPFYTTKEKGTGLGLSIAYRIMEEHNGRIDVRSAPGQGTTFEVRVPIAVADDLQRNNESEGKHIKNTSHNLLIRGAGGQ